MNKKHLPASKRPPGTIRRQPMFYVGILQALVKSFSVFYFLLLPVLYATQKITAEQMGYVGTMLIVGLLGGAWLVTSWLHRFSKRALLQVLSPFLLGTTLLLFIADQIVYLFIAYTLIGIAVGVGTSTVNAMAAHFSTKGSRFGAMAKIAMVSDVMRITYPLLIGLVYLTLSFQGLIWLGIFNVVVLGLFIMMLMRRHDIDPPTEMTETVEAPDRSLLRNRSFLFACILDFLDCFASSQLFVFLPALLIFKNFSIENALILQSIVFFGYLSGRWIVGKIAERFNGYTALGIAEVGMLLSITCIILVPASPLLYLLCYSLGLWTRGTSPVIKALVFDELTPRQMRRGTALYVFIGDSGGAVGQLLFGLFLAWFGVIAPFAASACIAGIIALACFAHQKTPHHLGERS